MNINWTQTQIDAVREVLKSHSEQECEREPKEYVKVMIRVFWEETIKALDGDQVREVARLVPAMNGVPKLPEKANHTHTCANCGKGFTPKRIVQGGNRHCSPKCTAIGIAKERTRNNALENELPLVREVVSFMGDGEDSKSVAAACNVSFQKVNGIARIFAKEIKEFSELPVGDERYKFMQKHFGMGAAIA